MLRLNENRNLTVVRLCGPETELIFTRVLIKEAALSRRVAESAHSQHGLLAPSRPGGPVRPVRPLTPTRGPGGRPAMRGQSEEIIEFSSLSHNF